MGDPLETIKKIVPWEDFRTDIEAVTETKPEERKSNAGRKPYDTILKFTNTIDAEGVYVKRGPYACIYPQERISLCSGSADLVPGGVLDLVRRNIAAGSEGRE